MTDTITDYWEKTWAGRRWEGILPKAVTSGLALNH